MSRFATVISKDGTAIAFERRGDGTPVILIGGAANTRLSPPVAALPMAELLAPHVMAIAYDRRGRGDSGDTPPYAVAREVEDIAALIADVGPAHLFGHSSGAALALQAAIAGLDVLSVIAYEPPYNPDREAADEGRELVPELDRLLAAGRNGDAVVHFLAMAGMTEDMIIGMRDSPDWAGLEQHAPTLAYDHAVNAEGGGTLVPAAQIARITVPVVVIAGGESPDWMKAVAAAVADAAPQGIYRELAGADRMVDAELLAPVLLTYLEGSHAAQR